MVALAIAAWLAYVTLSSRGPMISITFKDASGIEAGKTSVKYLDVEIGTVQTVRLSHDYTHVIVGARMSKDIADSLRDHTQFWVETPRVSAQGISGLGTLLSGPYIGMRPGEGEKASEFRGLETPPVLTDSSKGTQFTLHAPTLGSIGPGSPIYYRGIAVGEALGYKLVEDKHGVDIQIFIHAPYDQLVRDGSHFWNASGIDVSINAKGVKIQTESLAALLAGGIAFETPIDTATEEPAKAGTGFPLFKSREGVQEALFTRRFRYIVHFDSSVAGLERGASVTFRGIQIGLVHDVRIDQKALEAYVYSHLPNAPKTKDKKSDTPEPIVVTINVQPERAGLMPAKDEKQAYAVMGILVRSKLRAQLISASLLTGQMGVSLDFFPDAKPAELKMDGKYPEIPSVPSDFVQMEKKFSKILDNLAAMPLPQLVADLRKTIQDADTLLNSEAVQKAAKDLAPLIESLTQTSNAAQSTLKSADQMMDPSMRFEMARLLRQMTEITRSIRVLTNYLEQHPESLIKGKGSPSKP
ncbi:MAG: MlaD family protein [Alphaproteobacteria bacterium]|nr:MlaD family protein [Alphaproteobacteria bacterium]